MFPRCSIEQRPHTIYGELEIGDDAFPLPIAVTGRFGPGGAIDLFGFWRRILGRQVGKATALLGFSEGPLCCRRQVLTGGNRLCAFRRILNHDNHLFGAPGNPYIEGVRRG